MPLITPGPAYLIDTATGSGVFSLTLTPGVTTTAGDMIVVLSDTDLQGTPARPSSCTDSAGNTYTHVVGTSPSVNPEVSAWVALNTSPLTPSSTITVQWTASTDLNAAALGCPGVATGGALDQVVFKYTTNATISLATGQLASSSELAVAYWVSRQAQGAPAITDDWTSAASFVGAPPSSPTHYVQLAWKAVTTASAVTASATTPSAGTGWAGLILTFAGRLNPTATLSCGGSLTGFPVVPVAATATLHCGGSILGPAELAPTAPPSAPVFPAGYGPVTQDFENWVRRPLGYCTEQTVFRAEQAAGGGQALTASTWNPLAYDTILEDPWGGWSATSTATQAANSWLVPWTGTYRITFRWCALASSAWQDAALGISGISPALEAGGPLSPSGVTGGAGASFLVQLIGGADYVQLLANPSVSATTDTTALGRRPSVEITSVQTDLQG